MPNTKEGLPVDYDQMIADLVRQVDSKMEDIKVTVRAITGIIQERQDLEAEKKGATGHV